MRKDKVKITKCPPAFALGYEASASTMYGYGKRQANVGRSDGGLSVSATLAQVIDANKEKK